MNWADERRKFFARAHIIALRDDTPADERMAVCTLLQRIESGMRFYARQPSVLWYNMSNQILKMIKFQEFKSNQQYNKVIDVLMQAYQEKPLHRIFPSQQDWMHQEERARIIAVFPQVNPWTFDVVPKKSPTYPTEMSPWRAACTELNQIQRALNVSSMPVRQK